MDELDSTRTCDAGEDEGIDFSDIPEMTEEQFKYAVRMKDVIAYMKEHPGISQPTAIKTLIAIKKNTKINETN